jgi:hypothetical protein
MKSGRASLIAVGATAGLGWLVAHADTTRTQLTRDELTAFVVGNTIHYPGGDDDVFEFLAPDGVIHGLSASHGTYRARWRLYENDSICFEHEDPMASGCVSVVLRDGTIEYHRRDGIVEGPFPFLKGNPRKL